MVDMDFRKLSKNGDSVGVTLPKGVLQSLGCVTESGEPDSDQYAMVEHEGGGRFVVNLVGVDDDDVPEADGSDISESDMAVLEAHAEEMDA